MLPCFSQSEVTIVVNTAGAGGLSLLQFCNLNSFRTKFILGFSIFMGLSIPQYFNEYTAINGYGPVHTKARWVKPYKQEMFIPVFTRSNFQELIFCDLDYSGAVQ